MNKNEYVLIVESNFSRTTAAFHVAANHDFINKTSSLHVETGSLYGITKNKEIYLLDNNYEVGNTPLVIYEGSWSGDVVDKFEEVVKLLDKELEMREYKVSEQFIKEAHKAACSTWRTKLEEQFPEVFPRTYTCGSRFIDEDGEEFLLSQVGKNKGALINLSNGNRNVEAIYIDNSMKVTIAEIKAMSGSSIFTFKQ